jgi:hypothetical protein
MNSNTAEFAVPQAPRLEPTLWLRRRKRSSERPARPVKPDLLAEARARVLDHVRRQGESSLGDLPRAWPITRRMARLAAQQLAECGTLQPVRNMESGQVTGYRVVGA